MAPSAVKIKMWRFSSPYTQVSGCQCVITIIHHQSGLHPNRRGSNSSDGCPKVCTETTNVIHDYNIDGFHSTSLRLPTEGSLVTIKPDMSTTQPTLAKLLAEQAKDRFWGQFCSTVQIFGFCYSYKRHGILVRTTLPDFAVQILVQYSLLLHPLYLFLYPKMAGHSSLRRIYDAVRHYLYYTQTANDVYLPQEKRRIKKLPANGLSD